ncbi:MAG: glycosyltransferase [Planctomycetota bacterium]
MPAPCLFIAPQGLTVTGVTTWIDHVARGLADPEAGLNRPVGVVVHGSLAGHAEMDLTLPEGARLFRHDRLPDLDDVAAGRAELGPVIRAYRDAVRSLSHDPRTDAPVVVFPARHGECYAACAALTIADPEAVRIVGLQQIDGAYESAIIDRYEPALAALGGVSTRLVADLNERHSSRHSDTYFMPNAAAVPNDLPTREPLADRPVRLLYTGRVEHEQKRVNALVALSDALGKLGIAHELTILGDGPAAHEIDAAIADRPSLSRVPTVPPGEVAAYLDRADILVMASRTEGLSLSLLEAMARGCCPVITDTPSGARDAIDDGVHGVLVGFGPADRDDAVGVKLAAGIERAMKLDPHAIGRSAYERVRGFYNADRLTRVVAEVADRASVSPPRSWSASRPVMFNSPAGQGIATGAVPADGRARFAQTLERLAGRRVLVHGVGQHTRQLADLLASPPCTIVGFTDDDPATHGTTLFNWLVIAPGDAHTLSPDAVLISSAMHERAIYERRAVYESQGVAVARVYG